MKPMQDLSLNIFDRIDSICSRFGAEWKTGKRPRIEAWLDQVPTQTQPSLFRNLLDVEIKHRFQLGESPTSTEYIQRFPTFSRQVRQVFDESTLGSLEEYAESMSQEMSGKSLTEGFGFQAASKLGEYELTTELGRGGFGVVYEARHLQRNNRVALKTLPTGVDGQEVNADRLHKFRREFRTLCEINHPNLVGMQTLEVDGDQWFFTMDLVEGTDFLSYVRPGGELNETRLRDALKQLAAGIIALHEIGIVHRDLKPSNVMVESVGRVVILDFGLVAQLQPSTELPSTNSGLFAGTPKYAAPEQLYGDRSEGTDWYAFGTMLYESLTGESPFPEGHMDLMQLKQTETPPSIANQTSLPADLSLLVDQLLQPDAADRPATADIVDRLEMNAESPSHGSKSDSSDTIRNAEDHVSDDLNDESSLFGRQEQLEQLKQIKRDFLKDEKPQLIFISGLSGEGKSSLTAAFLSQIRRDDEMLVFSGRCYDRESVPFKALDGVIDALCSFLISSDLEEVESWMPSDLKPLVFLFPALKRVPVIAQRIRSLSHRMDDGQYRKRAFFALRELLTAISSTRKLILVMDDLQWGDSESAEGLADILLDSQPPSILVIGSYRSDEKRSSEFLKTWTTMCEVAGQELPTNVIKVGPLTEAQVLQIIAKQLNVDPVSIQQQIPELFNRTGGNPYLVAELADRFDRDSGRFHEYGLHEIVENRVRSLPDIARTWLELISVTGKATPLDQLTVFGNFQSASLDLLTRMRSDKLIRFVGATNEPLVDTYHDRIRETVLRNMRSSRKKRWHRKIGEAMETKWSIDGQSLLDSIIQLDDDKQIPATGAPNQGASMGKDNNEVPAEVFDLAYHFEAANDQRAFSYQLLAGHAAAQAYAMDAAYSHLRNAESRLPESCNPRLRYFLWQLLGSVSLRLRKAVESFGSFQRSASVASTPLEKAKSYYGIGLMHQQLGDLKQTTENYDRALNELKLSRPRGRIATLIGCGKATFKIACWPEKWQVAKTAEQRAAAEIEFKISTAMISYLFESEPMANHLYITLNNCLAARKTANDGNIAVAYAALGTALSGFGTLRKLGERFLALSKTRQSDLKNPELEGILRQWAAVAFYFTGKTRQSKQEYELAISLTRRFGTDWDLSMTVHCYRRLLNWVGSSSEELQAAKLEKELAIKSGNRRYIGWSEFSHAYALARAGKLNDALDHIAQAYELLDGTEYQITKTVWHTIHAFTVLQCSRYDLAREKAEAGWQLTRRIRGQAVFNLPSYCFWLESLAGPRWLEPISGSHAVEAPALLKQARKLNRLFPTASCRVERARGRVYAAMGKRKKAVECLERAVFKGRGIGMGYELSRSLLDLAAISETDRQANQMEGIKLLQKMESVIPHAESWLLGDHYDESLVAPEFDLADWETENGPVNPVQGAEE